MLHTSSARSRSDRPGRGVIAAHRSCSRTNAKPKKPSPGLEDFFACIFRIVKIYILTILMIRDRPPTRRPWSQLGRSFHRLYRGRFRTLESFLYRDEFPGDGVPADLPLDHFFLSTLTHNEPLLSLKRHANRAHHAPMGVVCSAWLF